MFGEYYYFKTGIINYFEFEGYMSGDGEAFCWAVDLETYVRLTGEEPLEMSNKNYITNMFVEDHYSFYGSDFGLSKNGVSGKVRIAVTRENDGSIHSKRTYLDDRSRYCLACGYRSKLGSLVCSSCGTTFGGK